MKQSNQPNQSNPFNVSRETLRTPSSYKVRAVEALADGRKLAFHPEWACILAALVHTNWALPNNYPAEGWDSVSAINCLQMPDLHMQLYAMPSIANNAGIGMHMLIVKNEEPTYVLFIGFYEFTLIAQIIAGIGQFKLVKGDECREIKTRNWVMSNVDKLSHRIVTCLFGSDLKELYSLL